MSTDAMPAREVRPLVGMKVSDIRRGMVVPETISCGGNSIQNGKVHSVSTSDGIYRVSVIGYSPGVVLLPHEELIAFTGGFPHTFGQPGHSIRSFGIILDVSKGVVKGYSTTGYSGASRGVATDFGELEETLKMK